MKKLLMCGAMIGGLALFSCEEEGEKIIIEEKDPIAAEISTPTAGFADVATADNLEEVLTFTWSEAQFNFPSEISYKVQIDLAAGDFSLPATLGTTSETTFSITYGDLNSIILSTLESPANEPIALQTRVIASAASKEDLVSAVVSFTFTAYEEEEQPQEYAKLWIAGDFQGWNIDAAATIASVKDDGVYEGYIFIPAGGTNEFKLYAQPAWEPQSYGTLNDGVIFEANYSGDNFIAPSDGYYFFSVDLNNLTYLLIKTDWGIIGAATPGGWDFDTELTFDVDTEVWSVTADMIAEGSFKFRANKEWVLDFGIDTDGNLAYANHPWLDYVEQPQLTVPEDGNYTITLDLHEAGNYTYDIQKN